MSHLLKLAGDTAVRSVVSWTVGFVMGVLVIGNVKKAMAQLHDKLDDDTPGGVGEVVAQQRETNRLLKERR